MGGVNLLGLLVAFIGVFLVFLGVTGRYQIFIGPQATASSNLSTISTGVPNLGSVPASNTAIPGFRFNIQNQNPVPALGNLVPQQITPAQQQQIQQLFQFGLQQTA